VKFSPIRAQKTLLAGHSMKYLLQDWRYWGELPLFDVKSGSKPNSAIKLQTLFGFALAFED